MAETYVVKQGDHLSIIAEKYGFRDFHLIWDHPNNEQLKQKRKNPHVLFPGDQLYVPDKQQKTVTISTSELHSFRVKQRPFRLRIALRDFDNQPIANAQCELEVEGKTHSVKSDSEGRVQVFIATAAREGRLRVADLAMDLPFKIGYLDPVEEDSGWRARLINLGYYAGTVEELDDQLLKNAIEEFQCDHGLNVTGELDSDTRLALKKNHGS